MRLNSYLNEARTKKATAMEKSIVQAWKNEPLDRPGQLETASETVEFLKGLGIKRTGKAEHLGDKKIPTSSIWKKYGGPSSSPPKTDFIIEDTKISLKKSGKSQLVSGQKGETKAAFYAVAEKQKIDISPIVIELEEFFNHMISGIAPSTVGKTKKMSGKIAETIKEAEKKHKEIKKFLSNILEKDASLKNSIVQELASGDIKFGGGKETADYILTFSPNRWYDIQNKNHISEIASKIRLNVGWKSGSIKTGKYKGKYKFYSTVRFLVRESMELQRNDLNEDIINKIKEWIKTQWMKIKRYITQSLDNLLDFLDIEPEITIGSAKL